MTEQPKPAVRVSMVKLMRVAAEARAHVKSVRKVLNGETVRGDVGVRIEEALKLLGMR